MAPQLCPLRELTCHCRNGDSRTRFGAAPFGLGALRKFYQLSGPGIGGVCFPPLGQVQAAADEILFGLVLGTRAADVLREAAHGALVAPSMVFSAMRPLGRFTRTLMMFERALAST